MSDIVTNTTLSNPIDKSEIETNFDDIKTWTNDLKDKDIATDAAIDVYKMESKFMEVHQTFTYLGGAGMPAVQTVLGTFLLPGSSTDELWVAKGTAWVCDDTGAGTGRVAFRYGHYDTKNTFQITNLPASYYITLANPPTSGTAFNGTYQTTHDAGTEIPFSEWPRLVECYVLTQDATAINAGGSFLTISMSFTRKVQES